jgi:hypothetical protein
MTRDMTRTQFHAALERNGFKRPVLMWCKSKEGPAISYGMLFDRKGKLLRRETIAYLIKRRAAEMAKVKRGELARPEQPPVSG